MNLQNGQHSHVPTKINYEYVKYFYQGNEIFFTKEYYNLKNCIHEEETHTVA